MRIKKTVALFFIASFVLVDMCGAAKGGGIKVPFSKNFNYINQQVAFSVIGPADWYGAMQNFGPGNKPLYDSFSKDTRVLYIKYYGEEEKGRIFNPKFEIKVFPKKGYVSDLDALAYYVDKVKPGDFLTNPAVKRLGAGNWAICEYKIAVTVNNISRDYIRKVYVAFYRDNIILVQATDTPREYKNDIKLFDGAVAGIAFSDNYMDLVR